MKKVIVIWMILSLVFLEGCSIDRIPIRKAYKNEIVQTEEKYDYDQLEMDLLALESRYRGRLAIDSIGKSVEGRELYSIRMGEGPRKLLIIGSVHGREWMTSYLLMSLVEIYLQSDTTEKSVGGYPLSQLLGEVSIYFVPMLNPDGVDLVLNGLGNREEELFLSMNEGQVDFGRWKANAAGVDLNRQFPADWEDTDSREEPAFENYKGRTPLNQPESKAIVDFTIREQIDTAVAYHLSGSVIFWYYHQKGDNYKRDLRIGKKLARITGYKLVKEEDSDDIAAGYKDWFVKEFKKPGYTIEIGDKRYDEIHPGEINRFVKENVKVIPYLMKEMTKTIK